MKKLSLLFVLIATCVVSVEAQVSLDRKAKQIGAASGRQAKAWKFDVPLESLLETNECIAYTYVYKKKTNTYIIPRADTGERASKEFPGEFWATVDIPLFSLHKKQFSIVQIGPVVLSPNDPPIASETNWSTQAVEVLVSPLDWNDFVTVPIGEVVQFAAIRITNEFDIPLIFDAITWQQGGVVGIWGEAQVDNVSVQVIHPDGSSVTLPASPSSNGRIFNVVSPLGGIAIGRHADIVVQGRIPPGTPLGRYALFGLLDPTAISLRTGELRVPLSARETAPMNIYTSEFLEGDPTRTFFHGSAREAGIP